MSPQNVVARYAARLGAAAATDPALAQAFALIGPPPERRAPAGFPGLLRAIISQQVSKAAGEAILGRVEALCGSPPGAAAFLAQEDTVLRGAGLSGQKVKYGRALAQACQDGRIAEAAIAAMPDEEAIALLTALPGIGRWTAEIYLLFALDREDVFPAADLALQVSAQRMLGLPERPKEKEFRAIAERWAPQRGVVARFLWHYYRHPGLERFQ